MCVMRNGCDLRYKARRFRVGDEQMLHLKTLNFGMLLFVIQTSYIIDHKSYMFLTSFSQFFFPNKVILHE